jgi:hypothetical protein
MNEAKGLFDLQLSGHTHGGQIWPGKYIVKMLHDDLPQGLSEFEEKTADRAKSSFQMAQDSGARPCACSPA